MEYKQILNKVKALLSIEVKLEQMKLVDGVTTLEAESFEADYSVGVVTQEGIVPAPVGVYETVEGMIITIEVEGIIKSVEPKATEEEVEVEATAQTNGTPIAKKVVETVSKETFFEEVKIEIEKLEAENKALKVELSEVKLELEEANAKTINFNPEPINANKQPKTAFEKFRENNKKFL